MDRRVVVTGIGVITPFGRGLQPIRDNVFTGRHAFREIASFDVEQTYGKRGAEAPLADRSMNAFVEDCAEQALQMAGLERGRHALLLEQAVTALGNLGESFDLIGQYAISGDVQDKHYFRAADHLADYIGSRHPGIAYINACVASSNAIGYGFDQIRKGRADLAVVGGVNVINPLVFYNFDSNRAMSQDIVRPFSKNRDGLLIGDGAAILILESEDSALARKAEPIANMLGWGISSDGFHVTQPEPGGAGLARAMKAALESAGVMPSEIDYINAHGTATPLNDTSETKAIKAVFGGQAYQVPMSSTKSMTGHMLEAAGAVEAVITIVSLLDGMIPPTANCTERDDELDLDYVFDGARKADVRTVMSNSSAFGGNNCSLIFRRDRCHEA